MRDKWYADKRDLVKWGGIMHLIKDRDIEKVVQVAYYREDKWPPLNFNGVDIQVPQEVLKHFRNIKLIKKLDSRIQVFDQKFKHEDRQKYTDDLCKMLAEIQEMKIVFLDPDTGLEPLKCRPENVKRKEVKQIFGSLNTGDILVFYQHKFFHPQWDKIRRTQFADACRVPEDRIETWKATKIANDVIFFFVKKG
jgi:hypothetical protein